MCFYALYRWEDLSKWWKQGVLSGGLTCGCCLLIGVLRDRPMGMVMAIVQRERAKARSGDVIQTVDRVSSKFEAKTIQTAVGPLKKTAIFIKCYL